MYAISDIKKLHLEISSLCNASCPSCPRNFHGYPYNHGYTERNLTLADVKQIFCVEFVQQLSEILINGNYGDLVMNPESLDIIEYFRQHNSHAHIPISTNGSARNKQFWQHLAKLDTKVYFCLDGLEDTHSLYRVNTNFATVIKNAKTYIDAGGHAVWKMIPFDHNRHQIQQAQQLSRDLGFKDFIVTDYGRNNTPVFDKNGDLTHVIGEPNQTNFAVMFSAYKRKFDNCSNLFDSTPIKDPITCEAQTDKSIYVSSTGEVFPCCYIGDTIDIAKNWQMKKLKKENNALHHSLEQCIQWFAVIESSWSQPTWAQGRMVVCNNACGSKNL